MHSTQQQKDAWSDGLEGKGYSETREDTLNLGEVLREIGGNFVNEQSSLTSELLKFRPWSLYNCRGNPKREKKPSYAAHMQVCAS